MEEPNQPAKRNPEHRGFRSELRRESRRCQARTLKSKIPPCLGIHLVALHHVRGDRNVYVHNPAMMRHVHTCKPYHATPYHSMPYQTRPYPVRPCHTIPCHPLPCHAMQYHTMLCIPYHAVPYHTISYHTTPHHTIHTMPLHNITYHNMT